MKQPIRPTRATLYFQFMTLRDLNPAKSCQSQGMFKKWKRHGEAHVNVSAFKAHCNSTKISGRKLLYGELFLLIFVQIENCKKNL